MYNHSCTAYLASFSHTQKLGEGSEGLYKTEHHKQGHVGGRAGSRDKTIQDMSEISLTEF